MFLSEVDKNDNRHYQLVLNTMQLLPVTDIFRII